MGRKRYAQVIRVPQSRRWRARVWVEGRRGWPQVRTRIEQRRWWGWQFFVGGAANVIDYGRDIRIAREWLCRIIEQQTEEDSHGQR